MMERWQALSGALGPYGVVGVATILAVLLILVVVVLIRRRRVSEPRRAPVGAGAEPALGGTSAGLGRGLAKTRAGLFGRLLPILGRPRLNPDEVDSIEAALLGADVGIRTTTRLVEVLQRRSDGRETSLHDRLEREIRDILDAPVSSAPRSEASPMTTPHVIMVVGVNGVGKTTSIGKLAARYARAGRRVLLVAADTFRAAAAEQLAVWAERTGGDLVRHQQGADPGAVAYDGIRAALARHADVVIVDTAGRLHTKSNLMEELRKVRRVIGREIPGAPHETLLVVDAVTGQNGLAQARAFLEQLEVTGVILTKLDGTAKGGIVLAIAGELQLPIRFVGVGEAVDDLREFDAEEFAHALLAPAGCGGMP
jgi:fused signal recognition particle receptor